MVTNNYPKLENAFLKLFVVALFTITSLTFIPAASAAPLNASQSSISINEGATSTITFTLDEPIICPDSGGTCQVVYNITNPDSSRITISASSLTWASADWNQSRSLTVTAVSDAVYKGNTTISLSGRITSLSEYYSNYSKNISVTVIDDEVEPCAPEITSIAPDWGSSKAHTQVTIKGVRLTSNVLFNDKPIGLLSHNSTSLTFTAPAGSKGFASIKITGCSQTATSEFAYDPEPVINSLSSVKHSSSGSLLNISGKYFTNSSVSLGSETVTITANTASSVSVILPATSAGDKTLTLSTTYGSDSSTITFVDPPKLILPKVPYLAEGDEVNLVMQGLNTSKFSSEGTIPAGLTLSGDSGELKGKASKEGIYRFWVIGHGIGVDDRVELIIDIDKKTTSTYSGIVPFVSKNFLINDTAKRPLDRLILKAQAAAPRNLGAKVTITGGAPDSNSSLLLKRHQEIVNYLKASKLKIREFIVGKKGRTSGVEVLINW